MNAKSKKSPTAFRTISEVAEELDVQQHVLRFWETKFSQIKPLKRGGGRRYYRPEDVALLERIRHLLYTEGYTIKGVQKLLKSGGKSATTAAAPVNTAAEQTQTQTAHVPTSSNAATATAPQSEPVVKEVKQGLSSRQKAILESMLGDLRDIRNMVKSDSE